MEKLRESATIPRLALIVSTLVALLGIGKLVWADGQAIAMKASKEEVQLKADKSRVRVLEDRLHKIDKNLTEIKVYQRLILTNMDIDVIPERVDQ